LIHKILIILIVILLVATILVVLSVKDVVNELEKACFVEGDPVACQQLANQSFFQFTDPDTGEVITPRPPIKGD
jgi:hypothetical protein